MCLKCLYHTLFVYFMKRNLFVYVFVYVPLYIISSNCFLYKDWPNSKGKISQRSCLNFKMVITVLIIIIISLIVLSLKIELKRIELSKRFKHIPGSKEYPLVGNAISLRLNKTADFVHFFNSVCVGPISKFSFGGKI